MISFFCRRVSVSAALLALASPVPEHPIEITVRAAKAAIEMVLSMLHLQRALPVVGGSEVQDQGRSRGRTNSFRLPHPLTVSFQRSTLSSIIASPAVGNLAVMR